MEPYNPFELRKFTSPEFHFGSGAIEIIDQIIKNLGSKKIMIVTDPGVAKAGWAEIATRLIRGTGIPYVQFSNVSSNPKDREVREAAGIFKKENCDTLVAVGGGSPIDCAKGISIMNSSGKDILEFDNSASAAPARTPLICIPTTAGASSDMSQFAMINNSAQKKKNTIISSNIIPDITLIDPITTTTMKPDLTAETGMAALVNAFEAYVSAKSSPVTDVYAIKAVNLISHNLIPAMEHHRDLRYRDKMMFGSLLAGLAFSNAYPGIIHSMAHALGGYLNMKHGVCSAILLENAVKFNFYSSPERYTDLARAMGVDTEGMGHHRIKDAILNEISSIRNKAGLGYPLGTLGVTADVIPYLAQNAAEDLFSATNPRSVVITDFEEIFNSSL